ncbi:WecB/TagA/CpsF family glycosyltransferase [uncultured Algibacter sp.]|uniref:WecB/TagA/CpsF family glycosyltransferase n=1 Tax=uncultured Algibacter sp. TaxID=298659 RepID=UPI002636A92D|nr:WecB/TagA/CpsF family glycosyltransferase [uncultured Algibacter sp.]
MSAIDLLKNKQKGEEIVENSLTTFINPFSYLFLRKDLELYRQFDYLLIDGIALIYLLRLIGVKTSRCSFDMTSLAPIVFESAIAGKNSVYFIGSSRESINSFIEVIKSCFKGINIIGFRNGFFSDELEKEKSLNNIVRLNPEIIIVGMGTPLQEQFLIDLKNKGWSGMGYTCGGFIHQTAKGTRYYPNFYNRYNLRWLYRIIDEPKLIKRYLINYPKSVMLFFLDYIRNN